MHLKNNHMMKGTISTEWYQREHDMIDGVGKQESKALVASLALTR